MGKERPRTYTTGPLYSGFPVTRASDAWMNGRGARIRTADLLRPRQARYQAAPRPELNAPIILPSFAVGVQYDSRMIRMLPFPFKCYTLAVFIGPCDETVLFMSNVLPR